MESTTSEIPELGSVLYNSNKTDSYSDNMNRLFAEDEMKNSPFVPNREPVQPKTSTTSSPAKSTTYFSAAAFWKNDTESVKVGVILSELENTEELNFLMFDASKRILRKLCVDDAEFQLSEDSLAVRVEAPPEGSINVKFVDRLTFLNFSTTVILRSKKHMFLKLSDGSGDSQIESGCDIRYNLTKHSFDEEGHLKLPDERKGVKTRLTKEKLMDHVVYKWMTGLRKGCHFLIKDTLSSVFEVLVDKIRKSTDVTDDEKSVHESKETSVKLELKADTEISESSQDVTIKDQLINPPTSDESLIASDVTIVPTSSPAPEHAPQLMPVTNSKSQNFVPSTLPVTEDIRDVLHRIIGIELDRIEMRLNNKFEKLQNDIMARLDHQAVLIQKILEKSLAE
ncbi:hypothetical protein B9Z55_001301 [Caenorhabditis nigoni]|uniref:Uncharacterized protein n=1 Tax=Caenorhabditis nigoni TaxID=1611254 RepID=A0A2G5VF29_9PELO|nr:hypothetical protein B9Z55_001301 [Caenorhabditis nigoni]